MYYVGAWEDSYKQTSRDSRVLSRPVVKLHQAVLGPTAHKKTPIQGKKQKYMEYTDDYDEEG